MLTMFNFVYTGENFGDVIFTDSTSGLSTIFFVIVSFLGNLVVLSQLVGSFQNHYGAASEKGDLHAEAKQRARRRHGYLCVYAQLAVRSGCFGVRCFFSADRGVGQEFRCPGDKFL
jgi:hypothetical protein